MATPGGAAAAPPAPGAPQEAAAGGGMSNLVKQAILGYAGVQVINYFMGSPS